MKRLCVLFALTAALVLGAFSGPALADDAADPQPTETGETKLPGAKGFDFQIETPESGQLFDGGTAAISIWFGDSASYVNYTVTVYGGDGEYREWLAQPGWFTQNPTLAQGEYTLVVADSGWTDVEERQFSVVDPMDVRITRAARPSAFYPLVKDGYKDKATISYRLNHRARADVMVINRAGRVVKRATKGSASADWAHDFTWNGVMNNGKVAPAGRYKIVVEATDAIGSSDTVRTPVEVTTDTVTKTIKDSLRGAATSDRSKSGNCRNYVIGRELTLDCWAGNYAQATYAWKIPTNAKNLRFKVYGEHNCCDDGRTTMTGKRVKANRYAVNVRVTNWRSYTIRWVEVSYRARIRR